jgi:hypothetical protein
VEEAQKIVVEVIIRCVCVCNWANADAKIRTLSGIVLFFIFSFVYIAGDETTSSIPGLNISRQTDAVRNNFRNNKGKAVCY